MSIPSYSTLGFFANLELLRVESGCCSSGSGIDGGGDGGGGDGGGSRIGTGGGSRLSTGDGGGDGVRGLAPKP